MKHSPTVAVVTTIGFLTVMPSSTLTADIMIDKAHLQGSWTATDAERDGAEARELVGHRIAFDGDRFRIWEADKAIFGGFFALDPQAAPAAIDFMIDEGDAKGQTWQGIVKIENAVLSICDNAPDPRAKRQRDFSAPKGSGYVCLKFRR